MDFISTQIVECNLYKFPNYRGKWQASKKSKYPSRNTRSSVARTIQNVAIEPGLIVYATDECFYSIGSSQIIR